MSILLELLPAAGPMLLVGGGSIAARKARTFVEGGFAVTVVAPTIDQALAALPGIEFHARTFEPTDIETRPWSLVAACTDDREVNRLVGELARARGILALVADARAESTAALPAHHRDGDLIVGVSTSGADPALAARLRDTVARALGPGRAAEVESARRARAARRGVTP